MKIIGYENICKAKSVCGVLDVVYVVVLTYTIYLFFVGILSEGEMQPGSMVPRDWGK